MSIAFFETEDWEEAYLREKLPNQQLVFYKSGQNEPDSQTEILSNFIGYPVAAEVLKNLPNLQYVTTRSTGYDHIDLKACAARGIAVSNVPTYGENTVAEFTFGLLLALSRKLYPALKQVKDAALFSNNGLMGFDLKGKTIGVIGTGHIGTYVVKIAQGFGMSIAAYDPHPSAELAKSFGFVYMSLEDLLKVSDVITLHVPYMPATHHLLNGKNLQIVKPGAVLINTARGGLVETEGLLAALKNGKLAGAALDVLEEEGFVKDEVHMLVQGHPSEAELKTLLVDHELMRMDNVLVTPHNAFNSKEALIRILDTTVENIKNFILGKPVNLVK